MRPSELAKATGTTATAIRFYERVGLLPHPPRHHNGYRSYPPQTVDRLKFIRAAQSAGLTLEDIRAILQVRDSGTAPCEHVTNVLLDRIAEVEAQIAALTQHRQELRGILERAATLDPAECMAYCQILDD